MLVGRSLNQLGVSPALNWEAISFETAGGSVRASLMRDEGRAVARTRKTEALKEGERGC